MHRKLNLRLALWSVAVLVPVGITVHFLHSYQVRRHALILLEQGDAELAQGASAKALAHYSQYLGFVPADKAAREKYARLFDRVAGPLDRLRAATLLQQLLLDKPDLADARYRLAQNLILVGRIGDAVHELDALDGRWPDPAELKHLLGWCHEALGHYRDAVAFFRAAIQLDGRRLASYDLLAQVLNDRLHEPAEAQRVLDTMATANPQAPASFLIRARFCTAWRDHAGAERDLQTALALAPDEPAVVLAVAARLRDQKQSAEAVALLERSLRTHPQEPALYRRLVEIKVRAGERTAALAVLARGLEHLPNDADLLTLHADMLVEQHDFAGAQREARELRRVVPGSLLPDYLLARIAVARAQWPDAAVLLERCRRQLVPGSIWASRVYALLGLCYHHAGDSVQELVAFRQAVKAEPGWAAARTGLGVALLEAGRVEDAITELQAARGASDPPPELWIALARALMLRNRQQPEMQRRWADVEAVLKRARAAQPDAAEIAVLEAEMLAQRGDFAAARTLLEQAGTRPGPAQAQLRCALAELVEQQGEPAQADQILADAESVLGDRVEIRLTRCLLWSRRSDVPRARLVALGQRTDALTPGERVRLWRELADVLSRLGALPEAEALWQQVAAELPKDVRSRFALVELALQTNRIDVARSRLVELRRLEGAQGLFWRFATAELRVLEGRTERAKLVEARKLLADLERLQPDWGRLPLLEARADEIEGRFDLAARHYEQAVQRGELQPSAVARLLELLLARQDYLRAEEVLGRFLQQRPLTRELARLGAEVAAGNRNRTGAQVRAAEAVPLPSQDYRDYLWHAHIDQEVGDLDSAATKLARAVELAPHAPDTWLALAGQRARTEQPAGDVLAELRRRLPTDLRTLTLARCQEALHDIDRAAASYELALAAQPNDFVALAYAAEFYLRQERGAEAERLLRRLLSAAVAAPGEHTERARRELAVLLARRAPTEALQLVGGSTVADERVRLYIQGQDPAQLPRALSQFFTSVEHQPATPADRLLLAELCVAAGKPGQARTVLAPLVASAQPQPLHVARYARVLLQTGELDEAARLIERLERWEPTAERTRALRVALAQARADKK